MRNFIKESDSSKQINSLSNRIFTFLTIYHRLSIFMAVLAILSPPHFVSFLHFVSLFWALENETIRRNQVFSKFSGLKIRNGLNSFENFSFFTDRIRDPDFLSD